MKGLLIAVIPGMLIMTIYGLTNINLFAVLALLACFGGISYGAYYYFKKTLKKGLNKFLFALITLFSYFVISTSLLGLTIMSLELLWHDHFNARINEIILDPEGYTKEELVNFRQRNGGLLSIENDIIIDDAILRLEQMEINKKAEEARKLEEEKLAEAKRIEEEAKKAEEAEKQKKIEEGYIEASGTVEEGEGDYSTGKMPFTALKTPDGTLTVTWTFTMSGDQGDLIRIVTFPPNSRRSSNVELQYTNFPSLNEKTSEGGNGRYEIIDSTTIKNHVDMTFLKFSSPFTGL